jgi:group I intron endonuclease
MIGIYKITSPTGKIYIGQSWDIAQRWRFHKNENRFYGPLQKSFKKYGYGKHCFEIIHELPTDVEQKVIDAYERLYIELYDNCGCVLLNIAPGGKGGKGYKHRLEDRKRMSEIAKKRGLKPEEITRMHLANKGRKLSEETKTKIRNSLVGKRFTEQRRKNISAGQKGRPKNSGSFKAGESPSTKLTAAHVIEIRAKYIPYECGYITLGREYNVDKKVIQRIIKRQIWKYI